LVAGIVKLDDLGLHLNRSSRPGPRAAGAALLKAAPYLMKGLSVAGTAAMFLVGGGILVHGIPVVHHALEHLEHAAGPLGFLAQPVGSALVGIVAGAIVLASLTVIKRLLGRKQR
jgi:predicted DNA repair protein MutK